ncbi:YihY/virulence factor BrkB family protein [Paenibacillus periandrae]|uniref:YihY/virulence factor BrkB family protein n=1 Tax=Paenibacillus periandrae TaxID=1761741 RepID=UPI001F09A671|nr:YihY/virulence factor BrkB family protein [Paenibacillus periandrae]
MVKAVEPAKKTGPSVEWTQHSRLPQSSEALGMKKKHFSLMSFAQNLYGRFEDDDVPAMGAQLTYYLILSFFPFLIFVFAVLSYSDISVSDAIHNISSVLPQLSDRMIVDVFTELQQSRNGSLLSIGLLATLWSASNGINAVVKALNKAYDVEENRPFWKARGISLIFTIILAVLIFLSMILLIFGKVIGETMYRVAQLPGNFEMLWGIAQYVIPLITMVSAFVLLYKYTPNLKLRFSEVIPGAVFATLGWVVASILFSFYVNNFGNYTKTYGSIGGIIVLLTWLYLSSILIILGGEMNATLHFDREGKSKDGTKKFAFPLLFGRKSKKK